MDPVITGVIAVGILFVLLALGLPIAFTMTLVGFIGLVMLLGLDGALTSLGMIPFSALMSYMLTVVPMFIIMGQFAFESGISKDIFDASQKWLARLPGGLACSTVVGCAIFAACTGSSLACAATMGKIAIPEMEMKGYRPRFAAGCVAAAGTLGILIPPSISAVLYASVTNESVVKLLMAGVIPGIVSALMYMTLIVLMAKFVPGTAPASDHFTWKEKFKSLKGIIAITIIFFAVMGSMYTGWATPTEAGAVGGLTTLALAFIRLGKDRRKLWVACLETARVTSMIFTILIGTTLFGLLISRTGMPMYITELVSDLGYSPYVILILILLLYIPLGMFLDTYSTILLTIPIVYPVITSLGFNGIWFGVTVTMMCEVGLITPPVAFNLYVVHSVAPHISLEEIIKGVIPFFFAMMMILAVMIVFPGLATWLPSTMTASGK